MNHFYSILGKHRVKESMFALRMNISVKSYMLMLLFLCAFLSSAIAQHCGPPVSVLAKWDFNSNNIQCNGGTHVDPFNDMTNPTLSNESAFYCPNTNNGCGYGNLGSRGHQNTPQYKYGLCLANFYNVEYVLGTGSGAFFDPNSTVFDPEGKVNVNVIYTIPKNTEGCLSNFSVKVLQKQFNGSSINFEKQGVAVKRNGVLVYNQTQPILASNINATPMLFTFSGSDFCSDGSEEVEFEIIFGLVHRFTGPAMPGTPGQTGYDDVCINGYCKTNPFAGVIPATCNANGANDDAKILIQNFSPGDRYDYNIGSTYTGSATYSTGSLPVPANGEVTNFANPMSAQAYTFRIFNAGCYTDATVVLEPKYCCVIPTNESVIPVDATCTAGVANNDAKILVSGVIGGVKAGYSAGTTYSGPDFSTASSLTSGAVSFNGLNNPLVSQQYVVRIFTDATCYIDRTVTIKNKNCFIPCVSPASFDLTVVPATCNGTSPNSNAQILVNNIAGGNRVGYSVGSSYNGPAYATANPVTNGAFTFTNIPNAAGTQIYTVRVFNTSNGCYLDKKIEITEPNCGPCIHASAFVLTTGCTIPESNVANNSSVYQSCKTNGFIDLELTKTVSPTTGATCATTGTPFVWTLTLVNKGNMTAKNVNVMDIMPAQLSFVSKSATLGNFYGGSGWTLDSLQANQSATLSLTTTALSTGTFQNCAYVNAAYPDNDIDSSPSNTQTANEDDDACASISVIGVQPPSVAKSFSPKLTKPNFPTKLTIELQNNDSLPITLTSDFVDSFPAAPAQMVVASVANVSFSSGVLLPPSGITATAGGNLIRIPQGTILLPGVNTISVDIIVPVLGNYCNVIPAGALQTTAQDNCLEAGDCLIANEDFELAPVITHTYNPAKIQVGATTSLTINIDNDNNAPMTLNQDFVYSIHPALSLNGPIGGTCTGVTLQGTNGVVMSAGTSIPSNSACTIIIPLLANVAGTYPDDILMNSIIATVGDNNNLGNESVSKTSLKVFPLCIDAVTASVCNQLTNTYSLDVSVTYVVPLSSTININGQVFTPNGSGAEVFTLTGLPANGASNLLVTAFTTDNPSNAVFATYNAPVGCSLPPKPSNIQLNVVAPTCNGSDAVNDGSITLNAISDADKFSIAVGASYTSAINYASASLIGSLPKVLQSNIPNTGGTYTIRFFNGADDCYKDTTITVEPAPCPCSTTPIEICPNETYTLDAGAGITGFQWFKDDVAIPNANSQTYIVTGPGVYRFTGINATTTCDVKECCPIYFVAGNCASPCPNICLPVTITRN